MSDRFVADEPRPGTSKDESGSSAFLNSNTVGGNLTTGDVSTGNITNTTVNNVTVVYSEITSKDEVPRSVVDLTKDARELQRSLVDKYKEVTLPNVSWMDEGVLTFGTYFVQLELTELEESIELEQIFDSELLRRKKRKVMGDPPKRILIEAPPGYGKTTLAYKLVYDWATSRDYLKRFEFAFLITLRNLEQSVPEEIADIAEYFDFAKKDIVRDILNENAEKTLIILDGLDELNESYKKHVAEVLFKNRYRLATVVVTSRPGSFSLTPELRRSLGKGVATKSEFNDEKINIRGLNDDNRRILLEKLDVGRSVIERVEEMITSRKELFECPLFVILLAFIVEEYSDVAIETKTDLFKGLVDCVARRSYSRLGEELPDDFTLFDDSESYRKYRDIFYRFGKLSDHPKNSLHFECNDETNEIYKMGFLIKREKKLKFSSRCYYEGFHLSILEFAKAYSLWIDYKNNGHEFTPESIDYVVKLQKTYGSSRLIIPFVCGLLGEEATNFFVKATPYAADFSMSSDSDSIWYIFAECKFKDRLTADTIFPFFPPCVHNSSSIDSPMWDNLHFCKKVQCDYYAALPFEKLSKNISMHYLYLRIKDAEHMPHDIDNFVNIKCNKLKFRFSATSGIEKSWFDVFKRISAKSKNLAFFMYLTSIADCVIKENILEDTPINKLAFYANDSGVDRNILRHFITRNRLRKLKITLPYFLKPFPSEELSVSNLTHLQLICHSYGFTLDLSVLTNNGRKKWKQLSLIRCNIKCTSPITDSKCVSTFKNIKCTNSSDVFGSVIPDVLQCDYEYIVNACRSQIFRDGFVSVKELRLQLDRSTGPAQAIIAPRANFQFGPNLHLPICTPDPDIVHPQLGAIRTLPHRAVARFSRPLLAQHCGSIMHSELESCFSFLRRNQSLTTRLFIDLTKIRRDDHELSLSDDDESSLCEPTFFDETKIIECLKWYSVDEIFFKFSQKNEFPWSTHEFCSFPDIVVRERFTIDTLIVVNCEISQSCVDSFLRCLNSDCVKIVIFAFTGDQEYLSRLLNYIEIDRLKYNIRQDLFKNWPLSKAKDSERNRKCLSVTSK